MTKKQTPLWVVREIRRLKRMIAMGGSSSALKFEADIIKLRRAFNYWL